MYKVIEEKELFMATMIIDFDKLVLEINSDMFYNMIEKANNKKDYTFSAKLMRAQSNAFKSKKINWN